jgi:hypothetical protein
MYTNGVSNDESLSDHNYLQYKIRKVGASDQNGRDTSQGIRFIIKEQKTTGIRLETDPRNQENG